MIDYTRWGDGIFDIILLVIIYSVSGFKYWAVILSAFLLCWMLNFLSLSHTRGKKKSETKKEIITLPPRAPIPEGHKIAHTPTVPLFRPFTSIDRAIVAILIKRLGGEATILHREIVESNDTVVTEDDPFTKGMKIKLQEGKS